MAETGAWTVLGSDGLADQLRQAAPYVEIESPLAITTDPNDIPGGAFATGSALLGDGAASVVSSLYGFRVLEDTARAVADGDVGAIYGCFGSYRLERGAFPDDCDRALADLLAWVLDVFPANVARVHARRASLLAENDAWFVTLRLADDALVTLEVMATNASGSGNSLLVEITGSERVIRTEPTRQAVIVERIDAAERALPWWEDEAERMLQFIAARPPETGSGQRLREVWSAVEQSQETGNAVEL